MRSKLNILHLIETVGPGGAETVFVDNLEYLRHNDEAHNHVAGFTKDGWIYRYIKSKSHDVVLFKTGQSFDLKLIKNLIKFIKTNEVSLIHSHLPDLSFYSSIAARITGIPHIMTEHGDSSHYSKRWHKLFIKYLILTFTSSKIVCVSNYNMEIIKRKFPWAKKKLTVIYNGIKSNEEKITILREKIRNDLGIKEGEIAICNIGNLYHVKGHKNLIRAMHEVSNDYDHAKLFIIGGGDLEDDLKKLVMDLKLEGKILFLGFRKDVKDILTGMDLFVLSSFTEGLPISIIEAMDTGLTIVSPDIGGISEIKKIGGDIYLLKDNSPFMLRSGIEKYLNKKEIHSLKNKNIVKSYLTVEKMSENYKYLYTNLIQKPSKFKLQ
jgi:glycosyltransferase involved in cell wall biosynthesis